MPREAFANAAARRELRDARQARKDARRQARRERKRKLQEER
jgi:hypothetical protein